MEFIEQYVELVSNSVKDAYSFGKDADWFKNVGVHVDYGKKYAKIVVNNGAQNSVHAFVDMNTGLVYKPATWKTPAKGARYDLVKDFARLETMFNKKQASYTGDYLYIR